MSAHDPKRTCAVRARFLAGDCINQKDQQTAMPCRQAAWPEPISLVTSLM